MSFRVSQQVQRRLSQHTDGSATEDVVSPTIRRVTNPNDGRKAPPPSTAKPRSAPPRSASQSGRRPSQYGNKFQVNEGGEEPPAHVVPVVDRSNMAHTGKILGEQGLAQEYAPMPPLSIRSRRGPVSPRRPFLAVLFLGSIVARQHQAHSSARIAGGGCRWSGPEIVANRSLEDIQRQRELNQARNTNTEVVVPNPGTNQNRNPAIQATGDHVLVLESYTKITPERMQRMQDLAARYNSMARKYANDGYQPWFGVRKPRSGGVQLVFGALTEGVFGIPRNDALGKKMERHEGSIPHRHLDQNPLSAVSAPILALFP